MLLLYDGATAYWGEVLGYLMISFIAVSGTYIFGTLLTANDSLQRMNIIFIISILLNILLNFWLIPTHKASGAAIATAFTQSFAMIAQVYLAIRLLKLQLPIQMVVRIVVFSLGLVILTIIVKNQFLFSWWWQMLIVLLFGGGIAMMSGMLSPRMLLASFKGKIEK